MIGCSRPLWCQPTHIETWKYNDQPEADRPQLRARLAADKVAARRRPCRQHRAHVDGYVPGGRSESVTRPRESGEALLYGEARGRAARSHSQLAVDGVEVPVDGAGAYEEPLGDLSVGHSASHQP